METLVAVAEAAETKRKASETYVAAVLDAVEEYGVSAAARAAGTSRQAIRQIASRHGYTFTGKHRFVTLSDHERGLRIAAYAEVAAARAKGLLTAQPCEVCGTTEQVEAHHDDYGRPLDVRWLCKQHHLAHHLSLRQGAL